MILTIIILTAALSDAIPVEPLPQPPGRQKHTYAIDEEILQVEIVRLYEARKQCIDRGRCEVYKERLEEAKRRIQKGELPPDILERVKALKP